MAHRLVWLAQARQDVREILTYIAGENPRAASLYVKGIRETADRLRDFPGLGRPFDERYRAVVHRNHLVFYSIDEAERTIRIARVIDGRRDIEALLKPASD